MLMFHHQHGGQNRNIKRFWKGRFKNLWTIWANKHYVQGEINGGFNMVNTAATYYSVLCFLPVI